MNLYKQEGCWLKIQSFIEEMFLFSIEHTLFFHKQDPDSSPNSVLIQL